MDHRLRDDRGPNQGAPECAGEPSEVAAFPIEVTASSPLNLEADALWPIRLARPTIGSAPNQPNLRTRLQLLDADRFLRNGDSSTDRTLHQAETAFSNCPDLVSQPGRFFELQVLGVVVHAFLQFL